MAEISFKREIESLTLSDGDTFHGEGIIAVTKALDHVTWPIIGVRRSDLVQAPE